MATKRDMEELKRLNKELRKSVELMGHQMEAMTSKQDTLMDMIKEIKELKKPNEEKDTKIAQLESRLSDVEQYTRMNDVIVTGLPTRPPSFAAAVKSRVEGSVPSDQDVDSAEQQVVEFLQHKGISINKENIEACHPLPQKDKSKPATIIVRFANRKFKINLLEDDQGNKCLS
ncbi:hypothetical protein ABVT39_022653 [Epinephelus coioides]